MLNLYINAHMLKASPAVKGYLQVKSYVQVKGLCKHFNTVSAEAELTPRSSLLPFQ